MASRRSGGIAAVALAVACGAPRARQPVPERAPGPPLQPIPASAPSTPEPARIEVEPRAGPAPWTHLNARNDPSSFRFAIVTDRHGGARAGVFESAIGKLNLIEPELVMSVGDLIAGYTESRPQIEREWDEFDAIVRGLRAPFFYVPGNHDLTNDTMREVWRSRYGPTYYAFVYKDVLFVCLDSMDGGFHQIQEQQLAWLDATLRAHPGVSWTLLFLHAPLWNEFGGGADRAKNAMNWQRVEALLGERRYTAFAGHYHRYMKHERRDRKHFTLATTGGGSRLRGPGYGEFDHVMWVTMTRNGPLISNLMLDGIRDENITTPELRSFYESVSRGGALRPRTIYYDRAFKAGRGELRVGNDREAELDFTLELEPPAGFDVAPRSLSGRVAPQSERVERFDVTSEWPWHGELARIPYRATARSSDSRGEPVTYSESGAFSLIRLLPVARAPRGVKLDGALREWGALPFTVEKPRQVLKTATAWRGPTDSRFRLGIGYDADFLYVAVEAFDDHVAAVKGVLPWEQDGVEIRVDARPDPLRSYSGDARDGRDLLVIAASPSESAGDPWLASESWIVMPPGVRAACVRNATGFVIEAAVPRAWIASAAGPDSDLVRVNVAIDDGDPDGQSQSWWWPDWRTSADTPGSGTFRLPR